MPNDSDFSAFVLDHFPSVYSRFTNNQDRILRTTTLLEDDARLAEICEILNRLYPAQYTMIISKESDLVPSNQSDSISNLSAVSSVQKRTIINSRAVSLRWLTVAGLLTAILGAFSVWPMLGMRTPKRTTNISCDSQHFAELAGCWSFEKLSKIFEMDEIRTYGNQCNIDYLASVYVKCKDQSTRNSVYPLIDLLLFYEPKLFDKMESEFRDHCDNNSDWLACIRAGQAFQRRILDCQDKRKKWSRWPGCSESEKDGYYLAASRYLSRGCRITLSDGSGSGCAALMMEDSLGTYDVCKEKSVCNGALAKREEILDSLCDKNRVVAACYSLAVIYSKQHSELSGQSAVPKDDFCRAVQFAQKACIDARKQEKWCKSYFRHHDDTDSLNPSCDTTGKLACRMLVRWQHQTEQCGLSEPRIIKDACRKLRELDPDTAEIIPCND